MKLSSLIKFTVSLVLVFVTFLTMMLTFPAVSFAQDSSNSAIETFNKAIKFEDKEDLANAKFFYQRAIDQVLDSNALDVFIGSKQHLAKIEKTQGNIAKSNELNEDANGVIKALRLSPIIGGVCGDCGPGLEKRGMFCIPCN